MEDYVEVSEEGASGSDKIANVDAVDDGYDVLHLSIFLILLHTAYYTLAKTM